MQPAIPEVWQDCSAIERDILTVLALDDQRTVSAIHRRIGSYTTLQTVSRNVAGLDERGYIERSDLAENRRFTECALTSVGRSVVESGMVDLADGIETGLGETVSGPEAEDRP